MKPDESELQIRATDGDSFLILSSSRSSLVVRGRRDVTRIDVQTTPVLGRLSALRRKAEAGDRDAQYELGAALREGYLGPESTDNGRVYFLRKLQELVPKAEDTEVERELKLKGSEALRKRQAEFEEAERKLHTFRKDLLEAIDWLQKAADQRHLYALADLGDIYLKGEGVDRNLSEALRCYSFAADNDLDHAHWDPDCVGNMWRIAADLGHGRSQYLSGAMESIWWERWKEEERLIDGYKWLSLAIASGKLDLASRLDANRFLGELLAKMSTDQIDRAKTKAEAWSRNRIADQQL